MAPSRLAIWSLASLTLVSAQFVPPPSDLTTKVGYAGVPVSYKQVPVGTCELDPSVKSFSGYARVGASQNIFFWFFEARNQDPSTAPLTVWINGGPGSSSMIGLFQELGPCSIDINGTVVNNPYSWSNASNMIFIDQPVGTGFSYSEAVPAFATDDGTLVQLPNNTCPDYAEGFGTCGTWSSANVTLTANSTSSVAPNFWKTLQGFMGVFPEYSREEFHFTTESYGGHYGPVLNTYIEDQNALIKSGDLCDAHEINLKTVMIGNGWYDPLIQYAAYYNYTVYPGNTYDYKPYNSTQEAQVYNAMYGPGNCYDQTVDCHTTGLNDVCSAADNFCYAQVEAPLDNIANRDEYDIREPLNDPFPPSFFVDYLNTEVVQSAIGAYVNYSASSGIVGNAFGSTGDDDREDGTIQDMRDLVEKDNLTVVVYAGDADYNCNWLGNYAVAQEIDAPGWSDAGFENITTSDDIVHGQAKQSGAFSFVRIYESGHEVPFYQPLVALTLFERAINGKDLVTGLETIESGSMYKTIGPATSTYREGNSTLQFGDVPVDATYNTTTNEPNPYNSTTASTASKKRSLSKQSRMRKRVPWTKKMLGWSGA